MQYCPEGVLRALGRGLRNLRSQDTAAPGQVALGVAPHERNRRLDRGIRMWLGNCHKRAKTTMHTRTVVAEVQRMILFMFHLNRLERSVPEPRNVVAAVLLASRMRYQNQ